MPSAGVFVGTLLHAVTIAHTLHLKQTGPGSYARHKALEELYAGLGDLADSYAEAWQGKYGLILDYPAKFALPDAPPDIWVRSLADWLDEARADQPADSELQNLIDEIRSLIDSATYKLTYLA